MSSILRFQLLNVLLIGLLAGCGGDDESFSSGGTKDAGKDGSSGTSAGGSSGTSSGGSSGTSTGGSSGSGATTCGDLTCTPPATCDSSVATPRCVCPAGYEDVSGDGSNCRDIDECTAATDDCHIAATCTNTPGSFTCACNAPAWTGDGKTCACATGYTAVGDQCLKENTGPCTAGTECATGNCVGGVCCALPCTTPGACLKQEGTVCVNGTTCRYGQLADGTVCDDGNACTNNKCFDGTCGLDTVNPGLNCSDNNACTTDTCTAAPGGDAGAGDAGAATCVHTPITCNDNNPCTTDTCNPAVGCQHTDNNTAACSDNNACTDGDRCNAGACVSTPKVCPSTDCTTGTCTNGTCGSTPKNQNGTCDDGLPACSATGRCSTTGTCTGQNDACGPLAASCAACAAGTLNCFNGRLCTCSPPAAGQPPHRIVNGFCVPDTNECNANPCASVATCVDPTPNAAPAGDYVCTCPGGYTGNGRGPTGCVDVNECTPTNPCGAGTCTNTTPPQRYTCACSAGYRSITAAGAVGPTCVCDLAGSYSTVTDTAFTYAPIQGPGGGVAIEGSPAGGVTVRSWSIRYHTVAANGSVTVRSIPCGGLSPTVCDVALNAAHAQYQSNQIWGRAKVNAGFPTVTHNLTGVVPGGQYLEPEATAVQGITLDNPAGAWPPCRQCVGVAVGAQCTCPGQAPYTVTNRATWVDTDEDSFLGMTTEDVSQGGELINGTHPDPPIAYTEPSECPRLTQPPGGYGYREWPGLIPPLSLFRTYRWYAASRAISSLRGTTITFDAPTNQCVIAGTMAGPAAGKPKTDARFQGCETCNPVIAACQPGGACEADEVDFYDSVEQTQQILSSNFTMRKLAGIDLAPVLALADTNPAKATQLNQICAEVREANCPAGKNCVTP